MIQINIWPFLWTHFTSLLCSFSKLKKSKVKMVECKAIYTEVHTAAKQSGYRYRLFFRFDSQTEIIAAYTVIFYEIKSKIWWYFNCLATNLSSNPEIQVINLCGTTETHFCLFGSKNSTKLYVLFLLGYQIFPILNLKSHHSPFNPNRFQCVSKETSSTALDQNNKNWFNLSCSFSVCL